MLGTTPTFTSYGTVAKRRFIWGGIRVGTNSALLVPTTIVLARLLSPAEFGVAAASLFFLHLAARLTQFGFGSSLVRIKTLRPEHLDSVFAVSLLLGVAGWLALTAAAPYLGAFLRSPETAQLLPVGGAAFILTAIGVVPTALLSRGLRARESAVSDWIGTIANAAVSIALAWNGYSYWSLIYGQLANHAVTAAIRLRMVGWWPRPRYSPSAMRELFSFGAGMYVKNLLTYAAQNVDSLIVGRLLGVTALGFYDRAFGITTRLLSHIYLSGPAVSFRVFSAIHEDHARFRRAYRKVILAVSVVGYPVLTGMIVTGPYLIEVLFGARWLPSVAPFQILCAAGMCKLLNTYASTVTQAKGVIWSEVKYQALFTVVLVVAVAALSRFGIAGAAAGVLLATASTTAVMQALVKRTARLSWGDMLVPQAPGLLCSLQVAVAIGIARAVLQQMSAPPEPMLALVVCVLVAACAYAAFVLFAPLRELRDVVTETVHDLAPALAKRLPALAPVSGTAPLSEQ